MKKSSWNDIKDSMRKQHPAPNMRDKESFWSDFRARVRLHPQDVPTAAPRRWVYSWAAAAACTILLLTGVISYRSNSGDTSLPATTAGGNVITWLDVEVSHSAVVIMHDDPEEGTVLWIVDADMENLEGDSV